MAELGFTGAIAPDRFWRETVDATMARIGASPAGLTSAQAGDRLAKVGPNTVADQPQLRLVRKLAKRFAEPLVAILLVAAAISGLTGDLASFVIIVAVVALSIALDVLQEHRAELTADALKHSVAIHADVRRDGSVVSLPVEQVVPGDVLELRAGDLVPADGLVVESHNLHVNEALMTGEPLPAEKRAEACAAETPAEAYNALFAGTSVVSGDAVMLVVATGPATRFGEIAAALLAAAPPGAFERGIHQLGLLILRLTVFLVLFVLLVRLLGGQPALESFLFAVALAVGLTPELLPMVMTVTLSRGAMRMAAKRVVVKKLAAIHDLGAMDVLCTDKTGTLTEAKMSMVGHPGPDGRESERVLLLAAINSQFETGIRSPLDQAVLQHPEQPSLEGWIKRDEVPFDFVRRFVSVLAERDGVRIAVIKGAPEAILERATAIDLGDGRAVPLDASSRAALDRLQHDQAVQGFRLLAVAWKSVPDSVKELRPEDEAGLVIAGFCVFLDPPKASAAAAIVRLQAAGVRVKVVSGDHDAVVRHVVDTLGIPARGLLTGTEIQHLTDSALAARVDEVDLYARVSPDQKTRIIRALQLRGHTVGFLGDGVNDAPAIHTADVGLSVDGATDVARSAADMILLSPDLGVLADGVEEGRRTFANILKYVRMGTSSNFGNMLSMALASLVLPFLPLLPVQILLNNLIYDLSEIGIPFDGVDAEDLSKPRAWDMGDVLRFTLIMGALSSVFDLLTFGVLLKLFHAGAEEFRAAWFVESTMTQILVIFIIRTRRPAWLSRAHPLLITSSLGALALAFAIVGLPLARDFGFVGLPMPLIGAIVVLALAYLAAAEIAKRYAGRPESG